jgi:outer membrane murein-binding lipoprotein Lpp
MSVIAMKDCSLEVIMGRSRLAIIALTATMLTVGGCVTQSDLNSYATKSDLAALRSELMTEITKAQDSAQRAEQEAAAASQYADCRGERGSGFRESGCGLPAVAA